MDIFKDMFHVAEVDSKGHLELTDPESWIENNPASHLALVTSLKLDSYPKEEIGESIGELTHLIRLEFWGCGSLKRVPNAITRLHKLEHLLFHFCLCLEELPSNVGNLVSLTHLKLKFCNNIKYLPNSIVNLSKLTSLTLNSCESLVKLPANIGQLASLTHLQLDSCDNIKSLPMSVANLPKLTSLSLSSLSLSELPCNLGDLKRSLTGLDLFNCKNIKYLPNSIVNLSNLTSLSLKSCESLVELPADIGQLVSLTQLKLDSCKNIKSLPMSIANLSNLTSLSLKFCESLTELPSNLGQMKSLSHLELNYCNKIKSLPDSIKDLCSLDTLLINECNSLTCYIGHITTEQGGVSQIYKDSHSYVSKDPIDENLQHTALYPQNHFNPLGNGGFMTNLPGAYSFGVNNQHAINDGQIGTMTFGNAHEIAPIFQHISSRGGNSFIGARNNDHALEFGRNNNTSQSYDADAIRQGRGITPEATLALLPATNMRLVDAAENLDVFCSSRRENSNPECESIPAIHTDQNDITTTEIEQGNGDNNHHDSENKQNQIPQNNNVT